MTADPYNPETAREPFDLDAARRALDASLFIEAAPNVYTIELHKHLLRAVEFITRTPADHADLIAALDIVAEIVDGHPTHWGLKDKVRQAAAALAQPVPAEVEKLAKPTMDDKLVEGPYRVRNSNGHQAYVERQFMCINGLAAWFIIATVTEPDEAEVGYSEGAIRSADDRAQEIANALNSQTALTTEREARLREPLGDGAQMGAQLRMKADDCDGHYPPFIPMLFREAAAYIERQSAEMAELRAAGLDLARIFHTSIWCRAPKSYRGSDWGDYLENEASYPLDVLARSMGAPMLDGVWYTREVKDPALKQHQELLDHLAAGSPPAGPEATQGQSIIDVMRDASERVAQWPSGLNRELPPAGQGAEENNHE